MTERVSGCKEVVEHDGQLLADLFWEFDTLRCNRTTTSELQAFKKMLVKYGNYTISSLFSSEIDFFDKPCEGENPANKTCKECKHKTIVDCYDNK